MSTIDASRNHGGSGAQTAGARPSRSRNVRRMLSYASVGPSGSAARRVGITLGLVIGSALLAASGAIHLQLWSTGYRTIPTIGPLFLIQGIAGALLAALLLLSRRLLIVVMAAGFMIATIGGLLLSIYFGLFGFMDTLAAPYAGLSLGVESAGAVLLAALGVVLVRGHRHSDPGNPPIEGEGPLCHLTSGGPVDGRALYDRAGSVDCLGHGWTKPHLRVRARPERTKTATSARAEVVSSGSSTGLGARRVHSRVQPHEREISQCRLCGLMIWRRPPWGRQVVRGRPPRPPLPAPSCVVG
jgi:hypothetical protein